MQNSVKKIGRLVHQNQVGLFALSMFLLNYLIFRPGIIVPDSYHQYQQAKSLILTDQHPAMFSIVWNFFDRFIPIEYGFGPFLLHLMFLWISAYLLTKKFGLHFLLLFLIPSVINFSGIVWKDTGAAFSLLLVTALALSPPKHRVTSLGFGFLLLVYSIGCRTNIVFATVPIAYLLIFGDKGSISFKNVSISLACVLAALFLSNALVYKVFNTLKTNAPYKITMIHDIVGISKASGKNYLPDDLTEKYQSKIPEILASYKPETVTNVVYRYIKFEDANLDTLSSGWIKAVHENPYTYLMNKAKSVASQLGIGNRPTAAWYGKVEWIYNGGRFPEPINFGYIFLERYVTAFEGTFFFKGWFYYSVNLMLIIFAFFKREVLFLNLSSILYFLPYIVFGQGPDFRYLYWSVISTILSLFLLRFTSQRSKNCEK
jgi:hypothetical protein